MKKSNDLLVLWDVDRTLLETDWTDKYAMAEAGRALIGREFCLEGVDMAGTLDPAIWRDIAAANGVADAGALEDRYRAAYLLGLRQREAERPMIRALPGTLSLVTRLASLPGVTQGVLSGNYPEIGRCKLECAGFNPDIFSVFSWGSDGRARRELFPVAFERYREVTGRAIDPGRVIVIGDTVRDVACALEFGCRLLAVATGRFGAAELRAAGAETVVVDLSDTGKILDWIGAGED
jgi:phosphoglycolate phosphatase